MLADKTGESGDGDILLHTYAGGDRLYWMPEEKVIAAIKSESPILVHRLAASEKEGYGHLMTDIFLSIFTGFCLVFPPAVYLFGRNDREVVLWITVIGIIVIFIYLLRFDRTLRPFKDWIHEIHIDIEKRIITDVGNGFNRLTKQQEGFNKTFPLAEVALICHLNCRWEQGCTVDLSLMHCKPDKKRQKYDEKSVISHIYKNAEEMTDTNYRVMPDDVKRVAATFVEVTGIRLIDNVTRPTVRKKITQGNKIISMIIMSLIGLAGCQSVAEIAVDKGDRFIYPASENHRGAELTYS